MSLLFFSVSRQNLKNNGIEIPDGFTLLQLTGTNEAQQAKGLTKLKWPNQQIGIDVNLLLVILLVFLACT